MAFVYTQNGYAPPYGGQVGKVVLGIRATGTYAPEPFRPANALSSLRNGIGPAGLTLDKIRVAHGEPERGSLHLEARNEIVRFGPVTAATISGTTVTVTIATGHNIQTGETVTIRQVLGATQINGVFGPFLNNNPTTPRIRRVSDTVFTISGVAAMSAFSTSANSIVEVRRPFLAIALASFNTSTNVFTTGAAHNLRPGDQVVMSQTTGLTGAQWLNRVNTVLATPTTTTFTIQNPGVTTGTASGGVVIPVRTVNNFGLLRVLTDRSITLASVSSANPAVFTTSVNHGFRVGDRVFISGVQGTAVTALNAGAAVIRTVPAANTFTAELESGALVDGTGSTATANTGQVYAGDVEYTGATLEDQYTYVLDLMDNPPFPIYSGPFNA